jgi:bifunctional non-homologous end joining protein LigD
MTTQQISRPDKVLYPEPGYTKADLAGYYEAVAEWMLPHLSGRPLVMHRFPDGIEGEGFYQKQTDDNAPDFVDTATLAADNRRGSVRYLVVADVDTLRYLANQACLELHRWLSRVGGVDEPDLMVIDIDPPDDVDPALVQQTARDTGRLVGELGLAPHVMATGGSGYHVVAPLDRTAGFDEVRRLARGIADRLAASAPEQLTTEQRKAARRGRIFLDTNRNAYGQTAITPYSPRARVHAPVATPIEFDELAKVTPDAYDMRRIRRRLAQKGDPWESMHERAAAAGEAQRRLDRMERPRWP